MTQIFRDASVVLTGEIDTLKLKAQQLALERDAMLEDIAALRMAERMNVETVTHQTQRIAELEHVIKHVADGLAGDRNASDEDAVEALRAALDGRDVQPPPPTAYLLRRKSDGLDFGLFMAEEAEGESHDEFEFIPLYLRAPVDQPPTCAHRFAHLGIDADGVMWCTECFKKPLVIPVPFGDASTKADAPFGICKKCTQPIDSFHNINGCPAEKEPALANDLAREVPDDRWIKHGDESMAMPSTPHSGDHLKRFTDWLVNEMPAGTVIGNPAWWARKLLAAACVTADELPSDDLAKVAKLVPNQWPAGDVWKIGGRLFVSFEDALRAIRELERKKGITP